MGLCKPANKVLKYSANSFANTENLCIFWEVKEGISAKEFQDFIYWLYCLGFRPGALMNILKSINSTLM